MSGPRNLEFNPLASHRTGYIHWWAQRTTAVILIPTTAWLIVSLIYLSRAGYGATIAWFAEPINAILMVVFVTSLFCHLNLGIKMVIEDYVRNPQILHILGLSTTILCWIFGMLSVTNVIILALS